jgi:preprotein translocase subunit SecF
MEIFKYDKPLELMKQSKRFGILSLVLVLLSLGLIFTKGFNYGLDFAGGTLVQVHYKEKAPIDKIRKAITKNPAYENASVTYFGDDNEIIIRTKTSSKSLGKDMGDTMRELLKGTGDFEVRRVDMVGAKVGSSFVRRG